MSMVSDVHESIHHRYENTSTLEHVSRLLEMISDYKNGTSADWWAYCNSVSTSSLNRVLFMVVPFEGIPTITWFTPSQISTAQTTAKVWQHSQFRSQICVFHIDFCTLNHVRPVQPCCARPYGNLIPRHQQLYKSLSFTCGLASFPLSVTFPNHLLYRFPVIRHVVR